MQDIHRIYLSSCYETDCELERFGVAEIQWWRHELSVDVTPVARLGCSTRRDRQAGVWRTNTITHWPASVQSTVDEFTCSLLNCVLYQSCMDISSLESKSSRKTMPDVFVENIDGTDSSRPVHVQYTFRPWRLTNCTSHPLITFMLTKLKHWNFMVK